MREIVESESGGHDDESEWLCRLLPERHDPRQHPQQHVAVHRTLVRLVDDDCRVSKKNENENEIA